MTIDRRGFLRASTSALALGNRAFASCSPRRSTPPGLSQPPEVDRLAAREIAGLHHRRQNRSPPLGDRQADIQADGSAAGDPGLRLRRPLEEIPDDAGHRRRPHGCLR